MTTSEKVAYIKGLAEGMKYDEASNEGKLLSNIIDVLADLALDLEDVNDGLVELSEQVDEIDEDLADLEDEFYGDDGCGCGCDCDCDCDCDCGCGCGDDDMFEVTCPACNTDFQVTEEELCTCEGLECPNCGEFLEFEIEDCCDDDCDCGCNEEK